MLTESEIEREISAMIVDNALERGYDISVFDGDQFEIHESSNKDRILGAMFSTGTDNLLFYMNGKLHGSVTLIYGNDGTDVISDHTENATIENILTPAMEFAARMEEEIEANRAKETNLTARP